MLVPFSIDPDSLPPDPDWTPAQLLACHHALLNIWQNIGLLVHDGPTFESSRLKGAVDALPQKLRPLWMEILERVPIRACNISWDGSVSAGSINQLSGVVAVGLVDDAQAEAEFGLSEDELSKPVGPTGDIEVCRILAAAHSSSFKKAIEHSSNHIEKGDTYTSIWSERFHELAAAPIKWITIVDRYAIAQHLQCSQSILSGLDRFLRLLDQDAEGPKYVVLFSAWTTEIKNKKLIDIKEELENIMQKLENNFIKQFRIVMLP